MARTVQAGDQFIHGRDLLKRQRELESEIEDRMEELRADFPEGSTDYDDAEAYAEEHFDLTDEKEELEAINKVISEVEGYGGWPDQSLILVEYFTEYVEQLVRDTQNIPDNLERYIDFEKMAEDYKSDYIEVTFDGYDYYYLAT